MRADRLISLVLLLQEQGPQSAAELARQLEVSVRTIYRDLDALSTAGIPVYGERGPGGGVRLLEPYRTRLTGLSQQEVRALFMLSIPAALAQLGVDQELRTALLKLSASLPDSQREAESRTRQRFHLDPEMPVGGFEPLPALQVLSRALWQEEQVHITLRLEFDTEVSLQVEPYGLVAKGTHWYLVSGQPGGVRVDAVDRIVAASRAGFKFEYPQGFNLAHFWQSWQRTTEGEFQPYAARLRLSPALVQFLRYILEPAAWQAIYDQPRDSDGWRTTTLKFDSIYHARDKILAFGGGCEVLEPRLLRQSVLDFAQQICAVYQPQDAAGSFAEHG